MDIYDPRKHHRRSTRLPGYDYSQPGYYFVTFCVHLRECVLGDVIGDSMALSSFGAIAREVLDDTAACFWNVTIDQSVIMPNHAHAIYVIHEWTAAMDEAWAKEKRLREQADASATKTPRRSTTRKPTLGQVVAMQKYETTKRINNVRDMIGVRFCQRGFYDHIVRTAVSSKPSASTSSTTRSSGRSTGTIHAISPAWTSSNQGWLAAQASPSHVRTG